MITMVAAMAAGCGGARNEQATDDAADSCCVKQHYEVDTFTTPSGKTVKFHALMHASICLEYDGKTIYVDPCSTLGDRTVDYSAMPKADIILVTHEHFDHYDTATLRQLTTEKTLEQAIRSLSKFGDEGVARFVKWSEMFG